MKNSTLPLSANAELAFSQAQNLAWQNGDGVVGTHHLLLGFTQTPISLAAQALKRRGLLSQDVPGLLQHVRHTNKFERKAPRSEFSTKLNDLMKNAEEICRERSGDKITTADLMAALLSDEQNLGCQILAEIGIEKNELRGGEADVSEAGGIIELNLSHLQKLLGAQPDTQNEKDDVLKQFTTDMTALARAGKFDPVIGREAEIERMMGILNRRSKNNPVLIGEAGVGKTALVEGLAQLIAANKVPRALQNKKILAVDMAGMVAGTRYRGDFEQRLRGLLQTVEKSNQEIILFIDELHTIVGAGKTDGAMDTANILKPALARGEIRVIGATTFDEFREIEKDKALQRRFQKVRVDEPTVEETVAILTGLMDKLEKHHRVKIAPAVLREAVEATVRYLPERQLPDKAIDVIDEAMAHKGLRLPVGHLTKKVVYNQLKKVNAQKKKAVAREDFVKAEELHQKEAKLRADLEQSKNGQKDDVAIERADIYRVIATQAGIPADKLLQTNDNLLNLEATLQQKVCGQNEALTKIAQLLKCAHSGLRSDRQPVSMLFAGPKSCGKNITVTAIAAAISPRPNAILKFDMSEFADATAGNALLGAAAGYVGHEEGGRLTEQVRKQPHAIVVLENIDRAHAKALDIIAQILTEGTVSDQQGHQVDFSHTTIIATLQTASEEKNGGIGFGALGRKSRAESEMEEILGAKFADNFTKKIMFAPLSDEALSQIAARQLDALTVNLARKGVTLTVDKQVSGKVGAQARNAREVESVLTELVFDRIAEKILAGGVSEITVEVGEKGDVVVR